MYEKINPKEAGKQAAKNIVEKMGVEFQNDDIAFDIIAKTVENMIFNIQSDYRQRGQFWVTELKNRDQAYNDLIESANGQIEHKNKWKEKYHKLLEENYNLRLSIDNYKEIFDRKDRVHNKLNHDYLALKNKVFKLETKVRRKYYNGMPKEVREELKIILESLETSCKFDRDQGYDQYNLEDPEYQRYEDLLNMSVKIKEMLK